MFALTETPLGVPPAQIAPLVAQCIGVSAARRIILTAACFDSVEVMRIGIADVIVDDAASFGRSKPDSTSACSAVPRSPTRWRKSWFSLRHTTHVTR